LYYVGQKGADHGTAPFVKKAVASYGGNFLTGFDYYDISEVKAEVAAYAAGFPIFDISYSKINDIIDKEGDFWKSQKKNIM